MQLLYADSSAVAVTNDVVGESFRERVGVKQSCLLSPHLLMIALELMEI